MLSLDEHFENEESPGGEKWAPLSPVTIARREAAGQRSGPILRASGIFRGTFNAEPSDSQVRIGTSAVQAAMLHFGGDSKGYMKATIPARPILGLSAEDEEEIVAIAEDWLAVE